MAERTLRRPKRPLAYAVVIAVAALMLVLGVTGVWSIAQRVDPTISRQ